MSPGRSKARLSNLTVASERIGGLFRDGLIVHWVSKSAESKMSERNEVFRVQITDNDCSVEEELKS